MIGWINIILQSSTSYKRDGVDGFGQIHPYLLFLIAIWYIPQTKAVLSPSQDLLDVVADALEAQNRHFRHVNSGWGGFEGSLRNKNFPFAALVSFENRIKNDKNGPK